MQTLSKRSLRRKRGYTQQPTLAMSREIGIPFYLAIELAKFYDVSLDYIAGIVSVKEKLSR